MVLNKFTGSTNMDGTEVSLFKIVGTTMKHFAAYVYLKALQAGESIRIRVYNKVDDVSQWKFDNDVTDSVNTNNGTVTNISSWVSQWKFDGDVLDSVGSNNGTITYNTNLKALYKFENNVNDSTSGANNLTVTGTTSYVTAKEGFGFNGFDGSTTYVSGSVTGLPTGTSDRTVSCWIKTPTVLASGQFIWNWGATSNHNLWSLQIVNIGGFHFDVPENGIADHTSSLVVQPNTWYHVIVTLSATGATTNLYIDGVLDSTFTGQSQNTSSSNLYIGTRVDHTFASTFLGSGAIVDELRIYNISVTQAQVSALYMNGKFAQSHTFDGNGNTGEFITFPSGSVITGTGDRTYAFWYFPTSFVDATRIIEYGVNAGRTLFSIRLSGTAGKLALFDGTTGYASTGSVITNVWNHVVFTISSSGTTLTIYINGVLDSTTTITAINTTSSSLFMGTSLTSTSMLIGQLDEVRVYNSALSASQVLGLYNYTGSNYVTPLPVGNALSLDGSSYVTVTNQTPYNFNSTSAFSTSCWFKFTSTGNLTLMGNTQGTNQGWEILTVGGRIYFDLINTNTTNMIEVHTNNTFNDGNWHNCIITYTGSKAASGVTIYIDGVSTALTTDFNNLTGTISSSSNFIIGARTDATRVYAGLIDEVQIFNYVVSSAEINAINAGRFANTHPIGLWHFDGDLYDYSGQGSTGSPTGTMTYVTGALSGSYNVPNTHFNFDGSEYVSVPYNTNFNFEFSNTFSFSTWIRTTVTGYVTMTGHLITASSGYDFSLNNGNPTISLFGSISGFLRVHSTSTVNDGLWHHIVATFSGNNTPNSISFYVDGVLTTNSTDSNNAIGSALATTPIIIGGEGTLPISFFFVGEIDDLRVYNRALSSAEVSDLYTYPDGQMKSLVYDKTYSGVKSDAVFIPFIPGNQYMVTALQTGGTNRIVSWEREEVA